MALDNLVIVRTLQSRPTQTYIRSANHSVWVLDALERLGKYEVA